MWNRIRDELNRISMENKPPMVRVYFGSTPLDTESYAEKRGEMYFGLRRLLREGRFHANLPLAVREQMLEQTYELDNQGRCPRVAEASAKGTWPIVDCNPQLRIQAVANVKQPRTN